MATLKTNRKINRIALVVSAAAVGVGLLGTLTEFGSNSNSDMSTVDVVRTAGETATTVLGQDSKLAMISASDLWDRPIQSGFRDPAPVQSVVTDLIPAVESAPMPMNRTGPIESTGSGLRLIGTAIEKGQSMAIVIDDSGKLDFRGEGDLLQLQPEGIRIESVSDNSIQIFYLGQSSTWAMGEFFHKPIDDQTIDGQATDAVTNGSGQSKKRPKNLAEELEMMNQIPSSSSETSQESRMEK